MPDGAGDPASFRGAGQSCTGAAERTTCSGNAPLIALWRGGPGPTGANRQERTGAWTQSDW